MPTKASGLKTCRQVRTPEVWKPAFPEDRELVLKELDSILASHHFRGSKRYPALLKYVVDTALEGRSGDFQERTLGVEVFGRDPNYDTNADPVVRFSASEVRKRIAQYYHETGSASRMQIELPLGSYVPEFIPRSPGSSGIGEGATSTTTHSFAQWLKQRALSTRIVAGAIVVAVLLAAIVGGVLYRRSTRENFTVVNELWGPLLKSPGQVLFVVGPVLQEALSLRTGDTGVVDSMTGRYDYISVLSAVALTHLTGVLQKQGRTYEVKESTETSLADMRSRPVVLVGAVNSKWTMHIMNTLRFRFAFDGRSAEIQVRRMRIIHHCCLM